MPTNPLPVDSPLHDTAETLLARPSAPLLPKAPFRADVRATLHETHAVGEIGVNVFAILHLLNDDLDAAHQLVQPHEEDPTACYIHGLMHRREGDWNNAKHWLRRAHGHPQLPADGATFVDECQAAEGSERDSPAARRSWREMTDLFAWCVANKAAPTG